MASINITLDGISVSNFPIKFDKIVDTDEQLLVVARKYRATHVRLPFLSDGLLLKKTYRGFDIVAKWDRLDDGRIWINKYWGGMCFGFSLEDRFAELPESDE